MTSKWNSSNCSMGSLVELGDSPLLMAKPEQRMDGSRRPLRSSIEGNWFVRHSQGDWAKIVDGARKEGALVVSIPASAELRKTLDENFKKKFPGIDLSSSPHAGRATRRNSSKKKLKSITTICTLPAPARSSPPASSKTASLSLCAWPVLPEVKDIGIGGVDISSPTKRGAMSTRSCSICRKASGTTRTPSARSKLRLTTIFCSQGGREKSPYSTRALKAPASELEFSAQDQGRRVLKKTGRPGIDRESRSTANR